MRTFCLFLFTFNLVLVCQDHASAQSIIKVRSAPTYKAQGVPPSPSPSPDPGPPVTDSTAPVDTKPDPYAPPVTGGTRNLPPVPSQTMSPSTAAGPIGNPPSPLPPLSGDMPKIWQPPSVNESHVVPPSVVAPAPAAQGSTTKNAPPALAQPPAFGAPQNETTQLPSTTYSGSHDVSTMPQLYSDNIADPSYIASSPAAAPVEPGRLLQGPPRNWFQRGNGLLRVNTPLSFNMLDFQNRQTDKELFILNDARRGAAAPSLTLGAQLRASVLYGRTNVADRFSYLGRFPPSFVGNTATDVRLLHANTSTVLHANRWAHGYLETLFSDVFSFQSFNQGSYQVRQAYVVLGDLNVMPFYAFLGKKTVPFGDMRSLSPFTQAVPWHYFAALAEGGGIGYTSNGLRAQVMALNGGRGIRVSDSEEVGHLNNFAANLRYDVRLSDDFAVGIGGGYLHGTIYDARVAEHIDPTVVGTRNAAWDLNGSINIGSLRLNGELVQTQNQWPATNRRVTAWQAEAAYDFLYGDTPCVFSGSFSEGNQGQPGTEFEFNRQLVMGLRIQPSPNAFFTMEYVRSAGFAPLINIATASDRSVIQHSAVFGVVLAI